ncbi:hypothetical protein RhiirA1_429769 [Rhizophagus irregularis]|nr:hypothetical protein RhiirA1_429769 [Rhizophagus irregularis]
MNKINSHYTAEVTLINARIGIFFAEAQGILDRINSIEKIVNDLYEDKKKQIELITSLVQLNRRFPKGRMKRNQLLHPSTEGISCDIWTRFKQIVGRIMTEKN